MCGILGAFGFKPGVDSRKFYAAFVDGLYRAEHRGPDGFGFWRNSEEALRSGGARLFAASASRSRVKEEVVEYFAKGESSLLPNVLFGHRRLTIIDISDAASQPMGSRSRQARAPDLWISYNGEIYNYIELRESLVKRGYEFQTQSDTEVILKAYEADGIDCFADFNGMWALAIWDARKQQLVVARDRMGVKPLYYSIINGSFVFASEIKQILQMRKELGVENRWNNYRLYEFLAHSLQHHAEETLYDGIYQLPPANVLTLGPLDKMTPQSVRAKARAYWSFPSEYKIRSMSTPTFEEASNHLRELLMSAVKLRLRSDVPVGSALSGGLDSSGIVSIVSGLNPLSQKTFSAIYDLPEAQAESHVNEKRFAESVIKNIEAQGREIEAHWVRPDSKRLQEYFSRLVNAQDGPFPSASMYPQWEVFRLARESGVVVMLDGQGADEIMGGYEGFFKPHVKSVSKSQGFLQAAFQGLQFIRKHPDHFSVSRMTKRLAEKQDWLSFFNASALAEIKEQQASFAKTGDVFRLGSMDRQYVDPLKEALYRATVCTSLPALLMYEDRNSMDSSIESRTPYLDYRLVEFVFSCSSEYHVRSGERKALLRSALRGVVPEDVRVRKDKLGYSTPERAWKQTAMLGFAKDFEIDSKSVNSSRAGSFAAGAGFWKVLSLSKAERQLL